MTTKRFTGQYHEVALGLYFYGARWYDPLLGRFTQADTIIPDPAAPQAFNRYAYTLNNPLRYTDSSGHCSLSAQLSSERIVGAGNENGEVGVNGNEGFVQDALITMTWRFGDEASAMLMRSSTIWSASPLLCSRSGLWRLSVLAS